MKFKVYPYKKASKSGRDISRSLGCKRILTEIYEPRRTDIIINWGSTSMPYPSSNHDLNKVSAVRRAADKLDTFDHISNESPFIIPEFTTVIENAKEWINEGFKVYCRLSLTAHSGRGIVIAETLEDLVDAPLYTKGAKNKYEFRVHVFKNKIIDIPDVDLSGLEDAIDNISKNVDSMKGSLESFEERLNKVEKRGGGRF